MKRPTVSKAAAAADPNLVWNTVVDFCFCGRDFTPTQRIAHLAFLYDGEVNNGGHYQFFENKGLEAAKETLLALDLLGASRQRSTLEAAITIYRRINPEQTKVASLEEFAEGAREGHYDRFDQSYYACKPTLEEYLKAWLDSNQDEFIAWTE